MDPALNEFVPIPEGANELQEKLNKAHNNQLRALRDDGAITEGEFQDRKAQDNPTFWKDEVIILKGYKFRVDHIGRKKLILKPIRG